MIVIGLTGSIGMGKSTTSALFANHGVPVHDADAVVHDLYRGDAVAPIEAAFPGTTRGGTVDRAALAAAVLGRPEALKRLEAIVHPLVQQKQAAFLNAARRAGAAVALLDIPLLLETGRQRDADLIVVVTAPAEVQRARVMARPGMTADKFAAILARQMPDAQKRRHAHALINTSRGLPVAAAQVAALLRAIAFMTR